MYNEQFKDLRIKLKSKKVLPSCRIRFSTKKKEKSWLAQDTTDVSCRYKQSMFNSNFTKKG